MTAWRAVVVAGLAGQVAASLVGALPLWALPVAVLLHLSAVTLVLRAGSDRARQLRAVGSGLSLAVAGLVVLSFRGSVDPDSVKPLLGLMLVGAQIGQVLSWTGPRELRSGLFAAVGLLVLSASYAPDLLVGIPLVIGWVAVLVALSALQGTRPVLPATAVALVLGLVAFLLVPVPGAAGARSRFGGAPAPVEDRGQAGTRAYSGDDLDLHQRGDLSDEPVATVPADSPTLWRSTAFDHYDGRTWTRPTSTVLDGGPTYEVAAATGPIREDVVALHGSTDGTIWSPGPLVSVDASGSRVPLVDDQGSVQLPGIAGGYRVTSETMATDPARLRSRSGKDVEDPRWRLLPSALPVRVSDLAQRLAGGATSRYDAAEAIAAWLRGNATYRLDSPVPGPTEDAVDRFLFVDRVGFCEQFASAEVVLLRSIGIPSRLVTGLAYGVPAGPGERLYRVADLHAWVELWVPGVGWVSSDPTAGVALAPSPAPPLRQRLSASLTQGLRALTSLPGGRAGLAVLLLALLGLAAVLVSRAPALRRPAVGGPGPRGGPALQAFLRYDARRGVGRRRPGESLRELSRRVEPEVARALEVVEQECYAPTAPDPRGAVEVLERS